MTVQEFLDLVLFDLRGVPVTVTTLLTALLILLAAFWVSWTVQRGVRRMLERRGMTGTSSLELAARLLHYVIVVVGFTIALETLGFSLGALFAAGAVFAVAIGFAMQHVVENFVSGVILLVERSIRTGDVIEAEGNVVKVEEMGIRTSIVRTREDERLIVPNALLVQGMVKNYTLRDSLYRLRAKVGVVYDADMRVVMQTLTEVATDFAPRTRDKDPRIQMTGFGSSSVDFDVSIWMDDPWTAPGALSELYQGIWWALRERDVTIAFPQLDVHLDPDVSAGLARVGGAAA